MITLYLDMDGVLANFDKEYRKYDPQKEDRKKFRSAVLEHNIFEKLDFMPDAQKLLNYVSKLENINIQILTSMGTHQTDQANAAKYQKLNWLKAKNIPYVANFVHSKEEKAKYANPQSILIDDSIGCISPFLSAGGKGVHHNNTDTTIDSLDRILFQLRNTHE